MHVISTPTFQWQSMIMIKKVWSDAPRAATSLRNYKIDFKSK